MLVDETIAHSKVNKERISGYEWEESKSSWCCHASCKNGADVGVGSEKFSQIVNVDFIQSMKKQYDLVILKKKKMTELIEVCERHSCNRNRIFIMIKCDWRI